MSYTPPVIKGEQQAADFKAAGLTGATAASRYIGGTTGGSPTTGTFVVGDWVADQTGKRWTCTVAGTPGTWVQEPGTTASDATPTTTGVVRVDRTPGSGHPVALTLPQLGNPSGIAPLDMGGALPSMALPITPGPIAEAGRWIRAVTDPLLSIIGSGQESVAVAEPCILIHQGQFKLFYGGQGPGGETNSATCLATCSLTADPTVTANWTRHGTVHAAPSLECNVFVLPDDTLRLFYSDHANMLVANSSDGGFTWTTAGTAIATGTLGLGWWCQSTVWLDETNTWQMLASGGQTLGPWQLYHFTSTDGVSFSPDGFGALNTLSAGTGMYGSATMPYKGRRAGLYHIWYHAAPVGNTPTSIYHATSPDLQHWTIIGSAPVVPYIGGNWVADPSIIEYNGITYLFHDAYNGTRSDICITHFPGTLAQLVDGTNSAAGSGSVTSVALSLPSMFSVTGSPVTSSGTLTAALIAQNATKVLIGPATGADAPPTFRALVRGDLPGISLSSLSDVSIISPQDQDSLVYHASTQKWVNFSTSPPVFLVDDISGNFLIDDITGSNLIAG